MALGASYSCNPANPGTTCEVGDLSGLFGALSFDSSGKSQGLFTGTNLPLSGANAVGGRSIVVHAASGAGARLACADTATVARATFNMAGVSGAIYFKQVCGCVGVWCW